MNKVILMGRLTKDPELRNTSTTNTATCSFSIAVDRRFKQENQPTADFINCVAWTKTAEFINQYFTKGKMIAVVGRIQTRTYDNAEGKKVYVTEVVVEEAFFAESKKADSAPGTSFEPHKAPNSNDGYFAVDDDGDVPF